MRKKLRIYAGSVIITAVIAGFPWLLFAIGVTLLLDAFIIEWVPVTAVTAVLISMFYVFANVKEWKWRIVMILLNPGICYFVIITMILISFFQENGENGFGSVTLYNQNQPAMF